jgi:sugar lactone lactonase YvrE
MQTGLSRLVLVGTVLALAPRPARATTVYFSDKDAARISRLDPGQPARVLLASADGLVDPRGVALDLGAGKLYWADNGTRSIRRANLDGSGAEDVITTGPLGPSDIELDLAHGHLYWADRDKNQIARANLDGSGVTVVRSGAGVVQPYYLALDVGAGDVYWTDFDSGTVHVARLDGAGPVQDIFVGLVRTRDLVIAPDSNGGSLYWADRDARKIQRLRLASTLPPEDLFTAEDGLVRPHGLALDAAGGMLYWTDTDGRMVARGNADGTGSPEVLATQGLLGAWGITLAVPEPGAAALPLTLAGLTLLRRTPGTRRSRCR